MVDTSGGLLRDAVNACGFAPGISLGSETHNEDVPRTLEELGVLVVNERGEVTTVVEDHVGSLAVGEGLDRLVNAPAEW